MLFKKIHNLKRVRTLGDTMRVSSNILLSHFKLFSKNGSKNIFFNLKCIENSLNYKNLDLNTPFIQNNLGTICIIIYINHCEPQTK